MHFRDLSTGLEDEHEDVEDADVSEKHASKKIIRETICALLELFSLFKAPKAIYMVEEVRELLDDV